MTNVECRMNDEIQITADCFARTFVIWAFGFPSSLVISASSFLLPFMHYELVSVRIAKLRHPTNWGLGLFHAEDDAAFFQLCDARVNVLDFKRDCCSISRRFPCRMTTDPDCHRAKIIFNPCAFHGARSRL